MAQAPHEMEHLLGAVNFPQPFPNLAQGKKIPRTENRTENTESKTKNTETEFFGTLFGS